MGGEVEAELLVPGRDPEAEDDVDELDDDERGDDRVGDRRADGEQLGHDLAGVAVDQAAAEAVDRGRGEDAGGDRPERPADAVDGEDVERVVDLEP